MTGMCQTRSVGFVDIETTLWWAVPQVSVLYMDCIPTDMSLSVQSDFLILFLLIFNLLFIYIFLGSVIL